MSIAHVIVKIQRWTAVISFFAKEQAVLVLLLFVMTLMAGSLMAGMIFYAFDSRFSERYHLAFEIPKVVFSVWFLLVGLAVAIGCYIMFFINTLQKPIKKDVKKDEKTIKTIVSDPISDNFKLGIFILIVEIISGLASTNWDLFSAIDSVTKQPVYNYAVIVDSIILPLGINVMIFAVLHFLTRSYERAIENSEVYTQIVGEIMKIHKQYAVAPQNPLVNHQEKSKDNNLQGKESKGGQMQKPTVETAVPAFEKGDNGKNKLPLPDQENGSKNGLGYFLDKFSKN